MESDRELLELAAKAAGIKGEWVRDTAYMQERYYFNVPYDNHNMLTGFRWNPLLEDGDALRLGHKLGLFTDVQVWPSDLDDFRRAIVRAAAEIGKATP